MPPYVRTHCRKCGHSFRVDTAKLRGKQQIIYRGNNLVEYIVQCPQCGHVFKIPVQKDDSPPAPSGGSGYG